MYCVYIRREELHAQRERAGGTGPGIGDDSPDDSELDGDRAVNSWRLGDETRRIPARVHRSFLRRHRERRWRVIVAT